MTHITHHSTRAAALGRRFAAGLLIVGSVLAATAIDTVEARPRTKSEVVAAEATRALDALTGWQATQSPADYVRFVQARESTATITATELELDVDLLRREWSSTSSEKQQAVLAAMTQLGVPYRSLKSQPGVGFDCSGLTIWAFEQAGLGIPRVSNQQFRASNEVEYDDAQAGDLVYYPGHISIYLGADAMVHSPDAGSHVEAVQLPTGKSLQFGDLAGPVAADEASGLERVSTALVDGATSVTK